MLVYHYDSLQNHLFVQVIGHLNDHTMPEVYSCYHSYESATHKITLDCKAVTYIDSSSIPLLLKLCDIAKNKNFNVIFKNMNVAILNQFCLLNIHKIFSPTYDSDLLGVIWSLF